MQRFTSQYARKGPASRSAAEPPVVRLLGPAFLALTLTLGWSGPAPAQAYRTIVVFGDTQELVDGGDPSLPFPHYADPNGEPARGFAVLRGMVQWVLDNRTAENIDAVLQVGDIIQNGWRLPLPDGCLGAPARDDATCVSCPDDPSQPNQLLDGCFARHGRCRACAPTVPMVQAEWARFNSEWKRFDGVVPYAIVRGTHDNTGIDDPNHPLFTPGFAQHYSDELMGVLPGYLTSYPGRDDTSHAWEFDLGSEQVLVLGLTLGPSAVRAWANEVIQDPENADLPVIAITHRFCNDVACQRPRVTWTGVVEANPEKVFMGVWGHFALGSVETVSLGGFDTLRVRSNWQGRPPEDQSYLQLIRFYMSPDTVDEVEVLAFSPLRAATDPNDPSIGIHPSSALRLARQPFSIHNDKDNDGVLDPADNCVVTFNPDQQDTDGNGDGDACQRDRDGDGIPNGPGADNCPDVFNPDQEDFDADGFGDACDEDRDGDGVENEEDLCPASPLGEPVIDEGCTSAQLLGQECDRTQFEEDRRFAACVARLAKAAEEAGLITPEEARARIKAAGNPRSIAIADYLPLEGGRFWNYARVENGVSTRVKQLVNGAMTIHGVTALRKHESTRSDSGMGATWESVGASGWSLHAEERLRGAQHSVTAYDSPLLWLPETLIVGDTYPFEASAVAAEGTSSYTVLRQGIISVEGWDSLTLPAGGFEGLELEMSYHDLRNFGGGIRRLSEHNETFWLSLDRGIIRREWNDASWLNPTGAGVPDATGSGSDELTKLGLDPGVAAGCGDLTGDTLVAGADDIEALRNFLAQPAGSPLPPASLSRCSVAGGPGDCDVLDLVILRRFETSPWLSPGIAAACTGTVLP